MDRTGKAKARFEEKRHLKISYMPEGQVLPIQNFFTRDWVTGFERCLKAPSPGCDAIEVTINTPLSGYDKVDSRVNASQRICLNSDATKYSSSPALTDLLVLYNLDYILACQKPDDRPHELSHALNLKAQESILLWLIQLDIETFDPGIFGSDEWHVLLPDKSDEKHPFRFRHVDKTDYKDDMTNPSSG